MPRDEEENPLTSEVHVQRKDSGEELDILREVSAALKSIRFGSIVLTIHEGRIVEITKTVRSRFNSK